MDILMGMSMLKMDIPIVFNEKIELMTRRGVAI